jgi:hypothetical protein
MIASERFSWAVPTFLLAILSTVSCTTPPNPQTPPPPIVTPRTNGDGAIYGGFAFPAGHNSTAIELDAPLKTENGTAYYSFTVNTRVTGLRGIDLSWSQGAGAAIPVQKIDGPCAPQVGDVQRTLMEARARGNTGRIVPASYDQQIDAMLDANTPVYWVTCEASAPGEVFGPGNATVDYNLAILLPAEELGGGGTLGLRAVHFVGPVLSSRITVPVVPAPTYVGVAGDSVAWGQGLLEVQKYYTMLFQDIVQRTGSGRLRRLAHSGAHLNRPPDENDTAFIADATFCGTHADKHGEVPRRSPTIQCQIRNMAAEKCRTDGTALGTVAVPSFICGGDVVPEGINESDLVDIPLDAGPRYDFVFMTDCINDVGPFAMLLGQDGLNDAATLTQKIVSECDLNNSMRDLRVFLPNATIGYMGYHYLVSNSTSYDRTGCGFGAPPGTIQPVLSSEPVQSVMNLANLSFSGLVTRSELFRGWSRPTLQASAASIDALGEGAGKIVFVDMDDAFRAQHATLAVAARSFGLTCAGGAFMAPVDPVAGDRVGPCSTFANPNGTNPNSVQEESCLRGSAFHPNAAGNVAMFNQVRTVLNAAGRYPMP